MLIILRIGNHSLELLRPLAIPYFLRGYFSRCRSPGSHLAGRAIRRSLFIAPASCIELSLYASVNGLTGSAFVQYGAHYSSHLLLARILPALSVTRLTSRRA